MSKQLFFLVSFFWTISLYSQDVHFSQMTRAQFSLNPAFTGTFSGNIRATMNWKDQWRSVNNTFRTYASSAEFSFGKGRARKPTFYALGIHAAKDVSGDIELGTTNIGVSFASLFKLTRNQRLSFGVQGAYGKAGINAANAQWGNQYVGLGFDPTFFDGEGIEYLPQQYWDVSAGVAYWYHRNDKNVAYGAPQDGKVGLAIYHINRPQNSFIVGQKEVIPMRLVAHGSALFGTPIEDLYWFPNITAAFQSVQNEIVFGALAKYKLKSGSKKTGFGTEMAVTGGLSFRVNNVFDAVIPQVFFDFNAISVGLSYDINVSGLNAASNYRGGFELSLRFTNPDGYTHKNPYRKGVAI